MTTLETTRMNPEQIELYEPEANTWWAGELTHQADLGGGAVFGHFQDTRGELPGLAVVYYPDTAHAFTVTDWQGVQPATPADIPLFTWRCGTIDALLLDGRPVLPPWASWERAPADAAAQFAALSPDAQQFVFNLLTDLAGLGAEQRQSALDTLIEAMEDALSTEQEKPL